MLPVGLEPTSPWLKAKSPSPVSREELTNAPGIEPSSFRLTAGLNHQTIDVPIGPVGIEPT